MKRLLRILVMLIVLAGAGYGGFLYWQKKQQGDGIVDNAVVATPPAAAPDGARSDPATRRLFVLRPRRATRRDVEGSGDPHARERRRDQAPLFHQRST
jgi:hypothetical protein